MNIRCFIVGACFLTACGGVSETGQRDERDRLANSDRDGDTQESGATTDEESTQPEAETLPPQAEPPSQVEPPPVPNPGTTIIITAPLSTPAPAIAAAPNPAPATSDTPLTPVSVDPATWLPNTANEETAPIETDGGLAGELRVDDLTLLVIFDNSGSMSTYWDGGTRWELANRSLVQAIEPVKTSLKVGAIRFPIGTSCGVPDFDGGEQFGFELGENFLARWIAGGLAPDGGTPLAQAFIEADEAIANASEMGLLEDRFNVLVITDGEPNCDGDNALLTELPAKWRELGVATVVLGLPGSTAAAALLDSIAEAGGTHAHQSLGTAADLDESVRAAAR